MFPESLSAVLFRLLCRLLENVSKALGAPCLGFCWGRGPVLALLGLCSHSGIPRRPSVLFLWTFIRGTLRKDSSGNTGEGQAGLEVQGTVVDFHRPGRLRSLAPSQLSTRVALGVQRVEPVLRERRS